MVTFMVVLIFLIFPPTSYYDDSTFSCEDNRNKEPREANLKKIEDMLKCIIEQQSKIQLQVERQDETIRNLEAQVSQLVEAFNDQYVNIMDSSQEKFALETEIEVPMEGSRVESQHSNHQEFEDVDVEEVILENKEPREADLKKIEDMLKCIIEQQSKIQLQVERQDETIRNLEAQVSQLVEAFNDQYVNIMDSSQEQFALETEIEVSMEGSKVESQHSNHLEFEDADVEEVILESTRDIEDTTLVDSSVLGVEEVENLEVHVLERVGPQSKHVSTLCSDGEMGMDLYEHKKESKEEVDGPYILKFSRPSRQGDTPRSRAKKCIRLYLIFGSQEFVPPQEHNHKLEAKLGV
ncbi:uncharacterized protein [Nicotiana sylvestris]|uniref:uncharacterized protein n=1 Tax=Nicotiana sylvestris TaxID=4096 RepID=UPI00388C68BA